MDDCSAEADKTTKEQTSPILHLVEVQHYFQEFQCLKIPHGLREYKCWCLFLCRSKQKDSSLLPFPLEGRCMLSPNSFKSHLQSDWKAVTVSTTQERFCHPSSHLTKHVPSKKEQNKQSSSEYQTHFFSSLDALRHCTDKYR